MIRIEPWDTLKFRCIISLGEAHNALPLPVQGQGTEEGAWVEGIAYSPEQALNNAYQSLGQAVVKASVPK